MSGLEVFLLVLLLISLGCAIASGMGKAPPWALAVSQIVLVIVVAFHILTKTS